MLLGKKKKIAAYLLEKKATQSTTAFDTILSEYLSGCLEERLHGLTMKRIHIHIDWLSDYKCINIQGKAMDCYFDIQIEPLSFSVAYDKDEPDDATEFVLHDVASFYNTIEKAIFNSVVKAIKKEFTNS